MKKIDLTQGKVAKIDTEDSDLSEWAWHINNTGYATRYGANTKGDRGAVFLHRAILERKVSRELQKGEFCDHINRDRLDNRRDNLRVVTTSENNINTGLRIDSVTGHRGIHYDKKRKKYRIYISYGKKTHFVARRDTLEEAILTRKEAEIKYWPILK